MRGGHADRAERKMGEKRNHLKRENDGNNSTKIQPRSTGGTGTFEAVHPNPAITSRGYAEGQLTFKSVRGSPTHTHPQ